MSFLSPCMKGIVKGMAAPPTMHGGRPAGLELEADPFIKASAAALDLATCPTTDELPAFGTASERTREASGDIEWQDWSSDSEHAASQGCERVVSPLSLQEEIEDRMCLAASGVRPWADSGLEMVRTLQAAPRNQGRVDLMRSVSEGHFVAVKRMPNSWVRDGPEEFERHSGGSLEQPWFDIGINAYLHAQGFVHMCEPLGIFKDQEFTYVASTFASGGDLFGLLDREPSPGEARENLIRPIMLQVFSAVRWLHDHGIAHCDISLENILLGGEDENTVKLIDFSMSTLSRSCTEGCGKRSYIAPEMLKGSYDPFMSDAFALGVVLFSLAARAYPWNSTRPGSCRLFDFVCKHGFRGFLEKRKVWQGNGETLSQVFSEPLVCLAEGLLNFEPASRLAICSGEIDGHPTVWDDRWVQMPSAKGACL